MQAAQRGFIGHLHHPPAAPALHAGRRQRAQRPALQRGLQAWIAGLGGLGQLCPRGRQRCRPAPARRQPALPGLPAAPHARCRRWDGRRTALPSVG
ncbi:hypothetical protein G6F68_020696 [Rhizopus microsporus]|nr:hypothetical protein G6F68_020696 [Rhizopus microsporus]